ncbi:hypothetical protein METBISCDRAFT_13346 [Metschnikowia bicuspidata]|uniref:Jacalin-type lectin domain-containing protein n=1 Tax=Metschnikowia bicuspidata TaxID=27322 RepID=A0A4P9ZFJ4_9ASCO|nr:hypothetical protein METBISCDRAFT_13346 [Metschnikowia bicuspidata]
MIEFNYNNEVVSSPAVIVSGRTSVAQKGIIQFVNNANSVFPPLRFEVNDGQFKALLHVSPGEPNLFDVSVYDRGTVTKDGFAANLGRLVDLGALTFHYNELPENKPIHLCVVVGRDSDGRYDMPTYKRQRGEIANLQTAIQRLKVAARMMQAFTQDEFHRLGLSNRSFPFVQESVNSRHVFGYDIDSHVPHTEVKVHVLRSPKTVAELRNPDYAQQNPAAKDNGFLFAHAIDLVNNSEFVRPYRGHKTAIQCAVMYLDSTWDGRLISTHAALGGGTSDVKIAVFGLHGLHSFPLNFLQVGPSLVDDTRLSIKEVANDANECSTSWECLNICMGAFMHEIGHLLGSPHQTDGVMLRDYIWWNRLFMTREAYCQRDKSQGRVIGANCMFDKNCHWNVRDLIRYFYHDSFTIPTDKNDASFVKIAATCMASANAGLTPSMSVLLPGTVSVRSESGIYMVELVSDDLARCHIAYYPRSYGGAGLQHELVLSFDELNRYFHQSWDRATDLFSVRVLSVAGDLFVEDFKSRCYPSSDSVIRSDFGLCRGPVNAYKGELLGSATGNMVCVGVDMERVNRVTIHHGGALDGIIFHMGALGKTAPRECTIGRTTGESTVFALQPGEHIARLNFRNGAWVDAVQIVTDRGRKSDMCGNKDGGHLSTLEPPSSRHRIIGFYGYVGNWLDGIGILYTQT